MSKKFTLPEPSEAAILDAIRRVLKIHPKVAWFERMNSGAHVAGEGKDRRFVRYGFKGCPDLVVGMKDGKTAWIEVKRPTGRLSDDQSAFLEKCRKNKIPSGVARSVEDAIRIIES